MRNTGAVERPHSCHPERSEGSSNSRRISIAKILRCAQNDRTSLFQQPHTSHISERCRGATPLRGEGCRGETLSSDSGRLGVGFQVPVTSWGSRPTMNVVRFLPRCRTGAAEANQRGRSRRCGIRTSLHRRTRTSSEAETANSLPPGQGQNSVRGVCDRQLTAYSQ
jgi:hypothetical protein